MKELSLDRHTAVVSALAEITSIRSLQRVAGVHRETFMHPTPRLGQACVDIMDREMWNLPAGVARRLWSIQQLMEMSNAFLEAWPCG